MKKVVAIVLVVGLLLGGVVGAGVVLVDLLRDVRSSPDRPEQPGARTAPEAGLQPFYDQELSWRRCGAGECTEVEVPLDHTNPTGGSIRLAVFRRPAGSKADYRGPLLVNPGGPGAPGTEYAQQASYVFGTRLLDSFDIIGFDPRGTGSSAPVDCLTDDQLDDFLAADPDPDTPDEVAATVQWGETMGQGCAEKSGQLAEHVSTQEAARDMDVIRAALGRKQMSYFGASYGTKLGATYTQLFPERMGRFVLDGAVDPNMSGLDAALGQAGGFQTALDAWADDCARDTTCTLGDSRRTVLDAVTRLLDKVDAAPMPVGSRELRTGNAFYGVVMPLYNKDYWPMLTDALEKAVKGDGSGLLSLSDIYASRTPSGYANNSSEAIYAINCLDDPWSVSADQVPSYYERFEKVSPTFGKVFAWGLTGCAGFDVPERPALQIDGAGADPLLVIGTTRDPATPMEWATAMAADMESAVLVTRDGDGHTGYHAGNDCVDRTVEDYLVDGTVPTADVMCH